MPVTVPVEVTREVPVTRLVTPVPQAGDQSGKPHDEVELRIIAINDFHGHIATSSDSFGGVGRADYLAATSGADVGGAVVAFMNQDGIREDILFNASGEEVDGELTFGEAFAAHPFGNSLITMSLTGSQIDALLESQFDDPEAGTWRVLQISGGFQYTWDAARPIGSKVDPASISNRANGSRVPSLG